MKKVMRSMRTLLTVGSLLAVMSVTAEAAPTAAEITGEIERLTLNDPTDVYSGGVMIVGGSQVILPRNLLLDLPANRLSLQQLFDQAPAACKANGESGLAKADRCNASGTGGFATLSGVHSTAGNIIAGDVLIEKGKEVVSGVVSYVNHTDGYFRVNGLPGDPATGVMVRLNDPTGRHTVQQGAGCGGGPNCSPDPRFTLDPDNYVNTFSTGYPFCIPSTVQRTFTDVLGLGTTTAQATVSGTGDVLCPATNRTPGVAVEPDVNDSRLFAPLMIGDSVNAEGNYEAVNGVRFLSSHTTRINKALSTKNLPTQPDYMFLEEVFMEAPGFQNQRTRALIIGFTTLAPTDVDFWTIHRDPVNNAVHEFPLASVQGCDNAVGIANGKPGFPNGSCSSQGLVGAGANIFRIRYDVDFLLAASNNAKYPGGAREDLNPCLQLRASPRFASLNICGTGITLANNFAIMSPIPHEIQARTGHSLTNPGLITLDIMGNRATNGQYLFPFGMNLGGVETADFLEIDVNLLTTPRLFEGIPWNLDRRLSPSGCLNAGGCEATPQPLDPFPYTGMDPRTQADFLVAGLPGGTPKGTFSGSTYSNSTLSNASNRVFSYVSGTPFTGGRFNFDGNNTLLPCALGSCPPNPGLITINPTPVLNIYPPVADEDAAVTTVGTPVTINVLNNDVPVFGNIDPFSVAIASPPASGTATVNLPAGTVTYTPVAGTPAGPITFSYTVANNYGAVSLPASVTVTILKPPVAVNDSISTPAKSSVPVNVVGNDTAGTTVINLASVNIVSQPSCGSIVNQGDGTVLFTAPATAPATCAFSYLVSDTSVPPLNSNSATVTVTITSPNPATALTIFSNLPSPQLAGTPVSFSAAAGGGSGNYEYQFWLRNQNGVYSLVQPYSPSSVWNWDTGGLPTNSDYAIAVQARSVGSAAGFDQEKVMNFTLNAPSGQGVAVTVTPSLVSPQVKGSRVYFTAAVTGGTGTYEYQFWLKDTAGVYSLVQPYSLNPTWKWDSAAATPGTYTLAVQARVLGSPAIFDAETTGDYVINPLPAPATTLGIATSAGSPQTAGAQVYVTGTAGGGSGPYEYQFWLKDTAGVYTLMQPFSAGAIWHWDTTGLAAGTYTIAVQARSAGSTTTGFNVENTAGFEIQ